MGSLSHKLRILSATSLVLLSGIFAGTANAESFQEALVSAYNTNPSLKAERARLREIDENYIQARAQGRLTSSLSGSLSESYSRTPVNSLFGGGGGFDESWGNPRNAQFQIIQPLYQGGRVKALKNQAKSSIYAARESLRNAEQNLLVAAATAYVDVRRDEETARIRRNNVSVLARQEQAARDRFDVGEGTLTDIAQSEARLAASNIGLAQADAALAASRATYERLVGHPPAQLMPAPQIVLPPNLELAKQLGVENNPQLLASKFSINAAESAIDVAKAAGRPTLSLNGTASALRGNSQVSTEPSLEL